MRPTTAKRIENLCPSILLRYPLPPPTPSLNLSTPQTNPFSKASIVSKLSSSKSDQTPPQNQNSPLSLQSFLSPCHPLQPSLYPHLPLPLLELTFYTNLKLIFLQNRQFSQYRTFRSINKALSRLDGLRRARGRESGDFQEEKRREEVVGALWELERIKSQMVLGRISEMSEVGLQTDKPQKKRFYRDPERTDDFRESKKDYLRRGDWTELNHVKNYVR